MKNFCNCRIGTVPIGTKLKVKKGFREWEYAGVDKRNGKLLLRDPDNSDLFILVREDEIIWKLLKKKVV